eukprot:424897_1
MSRQAQATQMFNIQTCNMTNNINTPPAPAEPITQPQPPQNDCREYLDHLFASANINNWQKPLMEERMANILSITEDYPDANLFQICTKTVKCKKWSYVKRVFSATFAAVLPGVQSHEPPSTVPRIRPPVHHCEAPQMQSYHPYQRRPNLRDTQILMEGRMSHVLLQRNMTAGKEKWTGFWQRYGGETGKESKYEKNTLRGRFMFTITGTNKISIQGGGGGGLVVDIICTKKEVARIRHFLARHEILGTEIWITDECE